MPSPHASLMLKVFVDVIILIAVALPVLIFYLIGDPFQRGFFCNDETIRFPFKESTVTSGALYAFGTIVPCFFIIIIEYFNIRKSESSSVNREKLRKWFWSLYRYIGIFLFGCASSHLTVDICKYSIGRLRPHFIDVCNPDFSKIDCGSYVTDDVCNPQTPEDHNLLREARLSFISGHASFSAFTMFYLIFFLQFRLHIPNVHLLRPLLQYLLFGATLFTSLSRVSDYKHHWSDVLMGFINGVAFATFCAFWIGNFRSKKVHPSKSNEISLSPLNT